MEAAKAQHWAVEPQERTKINKQIIVVYCENHMKHINTPKLCVQNAECLNVQTGGAYSYQ
jgi:hypothetical protein